MTVFVCGTYANLSEERGVAPDAMEGLRLPQHTMEIFRARSQRPIEACLAEVRTSDIMVAILGVQQGTFFVQQHSHRDAGRYSYYTALSGKCAFWRGLACEHWRVRRVCRSIQSQR